MDKYEEAIANVIRLEGGDKITNDPSDSGSVTKYGISQKSNPTLDIKNLTLAQAEEYYLNSWWLKNSFDKIQNDKLASYTFNMSVNTGAVPVISIVQGVIQSAMQQRGNFEGIHIDGILGPKSIALINEFYDDGMLLAIQEKLWNRYLRIIELHPEDQRFYHGWHNRVFVNS